MFDTELFWRQFVLVLIASLGAFFLIDLLWLRKRPKRTEKQNRWINILIGLWILSLFWMFSGLITWYGVVITVADKILSFSALSLATTGIVLIFKTSITTNFAQGIVATFGVYFSSIVITRATAWGLAGWQLALFGMVCGAIVSFLMGLFIDVFIIRKSKYITSVGKQMITMGLVLVVSGLIPVIYGIPTLSVPRLSYGDPILIPFGANTVSITPHAMWALVITVVLLGLLFSALRFTKWGLGVRATASNEIVAGMMGVNTRLITAMSWAVAGALGGVAAVLYTPFATGEQVTVSLMTATQVNGFMASILGGFSSFGGPIFGTVLIQLLTGLLSYFSFLWQNAIVYAIILLIVLAKPVGIFGRKIAKKV